MTSYTPNLHLPKYEDADKPNLRDQYNSAMDIIDTEISTPATSADIADGAVTSAKLADNSVTGAKIADGSITGDDFADATITTAKLADASVTTAKIADANVTTAKLADANVTAAKVADDAITTDKIVDANVTTAKLADASVTTAKVADGAITTAKLAPGAISRGYLGVIGDSFSDGASEWPTVICDNLGFDGLINKATGGAGYIRPGKKTFREQFEEMMLDVNFDKVKTIVMYGGLNDYVQTSQNISSYLTEWNAIYNEWQALPAASRPKMIVVFGNAYSKPDSAYLNGYDAFCDNAVEKLQEIGFTTVCSAKYWLLGEIVDVNNGDNIHPNAYGNSIIAGYMQQVVEGTYSGVHKSHRITSGLSSLGSGSGVLELHFDDGIASFVLDLTTTTIDFTNASGGVFAPIYSNANLYLGLGEKPHAQTGIFSQNCACECGYVNTGLSTSNVYVARASALIYEGNYNVGILLNGTGSANARKAALADNNYWNSSTNILTVSNPKFYGCGRI